MQVTAVVFSTSWTDHGTSLRFDVMSLVLALLIHSPLYFMKFDTRKRVVDRPASRLVAVDLIEEVAKPAPPPPVVEKESGLMAKLKALVRKEPPPPAPVKKEPEKLAEAPKPIAIQPKLQTPEELAPKLQSKAGFQTANAKLIEEKQLAIKNLPATAPLSEKKLGVAEDRAQLKSSKGNFRVAKNESLGSIGEDKGGLASPGPAIAIRTGSKGSTEKFSAAPPQQKVDKGKLGSVGTPSLGGDQKLGLRDSIIARDAAPVRINAPARPGGATGGGTGGLKKDAGSFQGGLPGGVAGGVGTGPGSSVAGQAPKIAPLQARPKKKDMFVITGPLKDRAIERKILPEYPAWAQQQGIEASVVLEFTVQPSGVVKNAIVVRRTSGYPRLYNTAIEALRQWKFAPLPVDENREEIGTITFNYSLS